MDKPMVISPARPLVVAPGSPPLEPGVERYVLKGGGTAVYALDRDDTLELVLLEGAQTVEVVAFGIAGKSDLAALGLSGRAQPAAIQTALGSGSEDAVRVRFGLFRRGLDIGRTQAAKLFGPEAPAGKSSAAEGRTVRSRGRRRGR